MSFETRRARWSGAAGAVLLAYVAVVAFVPTEFASQAPGPTFNTVGEFDGTALITISGRPTYPTAGTLDMTTVSESGGPYGGMYVSRVLAGWISPDVRVLPTAALYPPDVTAEQVQETNQADFVDSQSEAVAAALGHLHIPVTTAVVVSSVPPGTPASGKLDAGDTLVSVAGMPVTTPDQVGTAVRGHSPGDTLSVVFERAGKRETVSITAGSSPNDPSKAYLGIFVGTTYVAPFTITFSLDQVGGPSAGMMFSLGIVDKLTPGFLNDGKDVAGTGTITADGTVGPIGGIAQKMVGARDAGSTLFLAPRDNCDEVLGHVPDGLTVAAVSTLDDAVAALADYAAGRPAPACSTG